LLLSSIDIGLVRRRKWNKTKMNQWKTNSYNQWYFRSLKL
jgi:hypothetical protein